MRSFLFLGGQVGRVLFPVAACFYLTADRNGEVGRRPPGQWPMGKTRKSWSLSHGQRANGGGRPAVGWARYGRGAGRLGRSSPLAAISLTESCVRRFKSFQKLGVTDFSAQLLATS